MRGEKEKKPSKEARKEDPPPKCGQGEGRSPSPGPPPPDQPQTNSESVKCEKNQFAINRLVMMMMDLDPGHLCQKNIDDLKKVYEHLVEILRHQTIPPSTGTESKPPN